ncbi:hypothetical protein ACWCXK_16085 [Streptomyces sp. NPDC001739]
MSAHTRPHDSDPLGATLGWLWALLAATGLVGVGVLIGDAMDEHQPGALSAPDAEPAP